MKTHRFPPTAVLLLALATALGGCGSCFCLTPRPYDAGPADQGPSDQGPADAADGDAGDASDASDDTGTDALVSTESGLPVDAGPDAFYWASKLPTGAVRYGIVKADPARDLCFQVVFMGGTGGPCTFTDFLECNLEWVSVAQGASSCTPEPLPLPSAVNADTAAGTVEITASPVPGDPCLIDLDMTATFPPDQPWVPTVPEPFFVIDLPIQGC